MSDAPVVFIVHADDAIRTEVEAVLQSVGLTPESFSDPGAFLASVDNRRIGCVLLAMQLPGSAGLKIQAELAVRRIHLPVVFVTQQSDVTTLVRAMKAGATDVLSAPPDAQRLLDAVNSAIESDRARRDRQQVLDTLRARFDQLSGRERQVLALVVAGKINRDIARDLGTSEKTVKAHRAAAIRKMGATSLPDLVRMAERLGEADPNVIYPVIHGTKVSSR